jgi:hypothetical protein
MNDNIHLASPVPDPPSWIFDPRDVVAFMLDRGLLMFRPFGGPYFLTRDRRASAPVFVPDALVDKLLARGWLTRVDDDAREEGLFLLTAEGRRAGAAARDEPR